MQTQEKNRDKNLEQATHAAAQPKNKTNFFPPSAVCLLPIYYDYDLLFLDKSQHV